MTSKPTDLATARETKLALAASPDGVTIRELLRAGNTEVFRRLVDSVRDYAIFLLMPDGTVVSWNAGAQRIKGYSGDEIIGQHFSVFYPPEALERGWPAEELRRAEADGHIEDEGWRLRKDGSRFWANVTISAVRDNKGALLGFSKVTRDLTERREHERRLQESERNLRLLVDGVQDYAIFQLTPEGVISSWNLGAQRIKGYSADEAIGSHFSMFYPPDANARGWPAEELRRAAAEGHFEDEGWRLRKDGSRLWANVVITAIRDEHGELLGFSKVTRDLTERRRHEDALREREENLRLLVEGVKDHAMFLLDAQGRIKTWNSGAQRLLGYTDEDVANQFFSMLHPRQDATGGRMQSLLAAAQAGGFIQTEGWHQKADGTRFWAEAATSALRDLTGHLKGYVQIVRDLTEKKRVETLETEGRRLSEFIAVLSHELRNPLAPIRNAVSILKRWAVEPEAAWCVDLVGRQVDHMTRLVEDLMDVSRVTSGKIRLETVALDLGTLTRMAVDSMRAMIDVHRHRLELDIHKEPIVISGDSTRLTQVVANLLTNAAKYTPDEGHIKVTLTREQDIATLQVADTGIGMSTLLLQQAFEPFVQGAKALDRAEGGLGIGLTLVKRIVELHGGTVSAASAGASKGSTVTVTLPIVRSVLTAGEAASQAAASRKRRVLVVDDNRDAAETLAMVLRLFGHDVKVAYDGPHALQTAASQLPEIVLLDIGLPGMSGVEVGHRLKALPGLENVRLIAITGYGQPSDRAATREAGFDMHMTKPIDPDQLAKLLS